MQKKLGVLRLEGWGNPTTTGTGKAAPTNGNKNNAYEGYVPLPGDIDDTDSYEYHFVSAVAKGCTFKVLCNPKFGEHDSETILETILPGLQSAVKTLIQKGAQGIIANCGLFMWLHATGVIEHAVDNVMSELAESNKETVYIRPYVKLSSLTTLSSTLATLGVGTAQKKAAASWDPGYCEDTAPVCKVVVYTSNGDSCKALLEAIPQLKGLKIITPYDKDKAGANLSPSPNPNQLTRTQTTDPKPNPNRAR